MNHSKPDLGIAETKPAAIRPHCLMGKLIYCISALSVIYTFSEPAMADENNAPSPEVAEIFRPGVGQWCYGPVGEITDTLKADYLEHVH